MSTLKTALHKYNYDLTRPVDKAAYEELVKKLSDGRHQMKCLVDPKEHRHDVPAGPVELETDFLFANQWNTAPTEGHKGWRVFDWFEEAIFYNGRENLTIRRGHYLEITPAMRSIRENTPACGYCGKFEPKLTPPAETAGAVVWNDAIFCSKCLDNEYLKQDELHLLRLMPVALWMPKREKLTEGETAHLVPLYVQRQTVATDSRAVRKRAKQRADVLARRDQTIENARVKADGMIWLLDRHVNIDNVIYYDHQGRFCFGWRQPVSDDVAKELLGLITEFPYAYEIKGVTRSWEGVR